LVLLPNVLLGMAPPTEILARPQPGEARPDYLSDGTPVWVIGLADGTVNVLLGFDQHRPNNLGKVLWWCPTAEALDNPEHGSKYDPYGHVIEGPAPYGLPAFGGRVEGGQVVVEQLGPPPPREVPHVGPPSHERDWCTFPEDEVVYHTFDGWPAWDSPTAAVEAAPEGWILLNGSLAPRGDQAILCSVGGCDDGVVAGNMLGPFRGDEFGPFFGERFIARVRDGALTDVTRVMPMGAP
jgi:hypothetical protein